MSKLAIQYIQYTVSSTCANLTWNVVGGDDEKYSFRIKTVGGLKGDLKIDHCPQMQTKAFLRLEPGHCYTVTVEVVNRNKILTSADVRFKSILCQREIAALHVRSMNFICKDVFGQDLEEITVFYRSKPPAYWQQIQLTDGIMRPYIKDSTGHPGSPINGEINGLFFSGRLIHGALPIASPYGAQRFQIPCQKLYLPERHHLYFADFYCNVNRHYVTLVICEVDSDVDKYCSDKLIPLDPFNNMFLRVAVHNSYDYKYYLNNNIWVEILYTADLRLWWGKFDYVFPLGESDPSGIPNNKACQICNLFPLNSGDGEIIMK